MTKNLTSPTIKEEEKLLEYFNAGDYKVAEILANEITVKYPNDPFGWRILGAVFAMVGRFETHYLQAKN